MKNILTIFLLLTCGLCFGQNLVPNPSFEEIDTCPTFPSQVYRANGWYTVRETPDYFQACCNTTFPVCGVPNNVFGFRNAATGVAYCGFLTYDSQIFVREYLGRQLSEKLIAGSRYYVSFTLSSSSSRNQGVNGGSDKSGILFSTNKFDLTNIPPANNHCQVWADSIVRDTIGWVMIKGSFIADSAYEFITLGNFFADSAVNSVKYWTQNGNFRSAYNYIDDVCVTTDSLGCDFTSSIEQPEQNFDIGLFPNPFSNQLTFSLSYKEHTTVSLYNFLGQQVLQQTFSNATTINTEQMPDGIYFYELKNTKGIIKSGKVVKQ